MNKNEKKMLARLDEVALGNLDKASFKASLRLQVWFTGRTHELFLEFGKAARAVFLQFANDDGILDGTRGFQVQSELLKLWGDAFSQWRDEFLLARREAASIPFGVVAVRHEKLMMNDEGGRMNESALSEAIEDGVFKPQIEIILSSAENWIYGTRITNSGQNQNLNARIWNVDGAGRDAINEVIMQGVTDGDSAWNLAKKLEQYLGAGENCPRWTSTRLYGRTAKEKAAGDTSGLLSGNDCDGSGVSYKALRLARTEIQKAHALATDKLLALQPWVQMEKCNLSAAHPEPDECDDIAQGGEKSDGVYPVGTIEYPLHPNCFCFKTAVLMDADAFTSQLNGWLKGESWPEMDEYKRSIGGDVAISLMSDALSLAVWLFDDDLASVFGAKRLGF